MKFITSKDAFVKVLGVCQEVINSKSPISILSNVYLEADDNCIIVKCTNSAVSAKTKFTADVLEKGSTTVFCGKLFAIINQLPDGNIEFETVDKEIQVKSENKKIKYKLKSLAVDKFPEIIEYKKDGSIEVAAKDFRECIKNTLFAVSTDSCRYMMTGCYLVAEDNKISMVATDGKRMSVGSFSSDKGLTSVIIPPKILQITMMLSGTEGNIEINATEKMFFIKIGDYELSSSVIDAQFPNYKRVFPVGLDHTFKVSRVSLEKALKRACVMAEKVARINFTVTDNKIIIESPDSEIGKSSEEIDIEYSGEDAKIAFNAVFVLDVLSVLTADTICFDFKIEQPDIVKSAVIIREENPSYDYCHIVMPIAY